RRTPRPAAERPRHESANPPRIGRRRPRRGGRRPALGLGAWAPGLGARALGLGLLSLALWVWAGRVAGHANIGEGRAVWRRARPARGGEDRAAVGGARPLGTWAWALGLGHLGLGTW